MLANVVAIVAVLGLLVVAFILLWNFVSEGEGDHGGGDDGDSDDSGGDDDRDDDDDDDDPGYHDVNVPTRGAPGPYTQLGILSTDNKDQDESQKNNVLPLYGRQTYSRSHRFNYYTQLDNGVRVPLSMGGKPCEAALGCPEVYDGDQVVIPQLGASYTVRLYEEPPIRYIPYS